MTSAGLRRTALIRALRIAGWAALLAPVGLVLHELGHLAAAWTLGFDNARLRVASVSGGARLDSAPDWMVAVQAGSGPLVTLLLLALAYAFAARPPRPNWAISLAATAPLRLLVGTAYLVFSLIAWVQGQPSSTPNFDEYNLAAGLGISAIPFAVLGTLILFGTWIWLWRIMPRGARFVSVIAIAAGTAAGLFLWMTLVGPAVVALVNRGG